MGVLNETCYDHVRGEGFFTMTAAEVWSIAMVKRLKAARPGEVDIRHTNPDGSMVVRMPFDWMRVVPKKRDTLTDEQRQERRKRMTSTRLRSHTAQQEVNGPNSDE